MERADFETSTKRAQRAYTEGRVSGPITKDFKWLTDRWNWWPDTTVVSCQLWNAAGGPALLGLHRRTYWLCMGWSKIEVLQGVDPVDPVDSIQNGGHGHDA